MEEKPYVFDYQNSRKVTNIKRPDTILPVAALIFLGSIQFYKKKIFKIDRKPINFALFSGASLWVSYQWSSFFLSSPIIEAGIINNEKEKNLNLN